MTRRENKIEKRIKQDKKWIPTIRGEIKIEKRIKQNKELLERMQKRNRAYLCSGLPICIHKGGYKHCSHAHYHNPYFTEMQENTCRKPCRYLSPMRIRCIQVKKEI